MQGTKVSTPISHLVADGDVPRPLVPRPEPVAHAVRLARRVQTTRQSPSSTGTNRHYDQLSFLAASPAKQPFSLLTLSGR